MERYLTRHAEAEAALCDASHHGHVLTVPVYDEGDSFLRLLSSVEAGPLGSALVIAVVNARDDSGKAVMERNRLLLARLRDTFPTPKPIRPTGQNAENALLLDTPFGELLCIDRSSSARLARKRGVGLARKIAGDLALALHARGKIASRWIHLSDADAVLPSDYFARVDAAHVDVTQVDAARTDAAEGARTSFAKHQAGAIRATDGRLAVAAIYPFRHVSPRAALSRAGALHEMYMRHYVVGLQSAGSPYAFHSIGSLIALSASAYAEVRGVPRRHGGEDFYLLNKLAKLGRIARLSGTPIELEARASTRVPFGTGPAIRRLMDGEIPPDLFHHAHSFHALAALLGVIEPALCRERPSDGIALLREEGAKRQLAASLMEEMADFLELESQLGQSMARSGRPATRLRDWHTKFDALRTLQLLHWLRDRRFPSYGWRPAMSALGLDVAREPEAVLEDLIALEGQLCVATRGLG